MNKASNENLPDYVSEIMGSEQAHARKTLKSQVLLDWLKPFRQKYIVNGFLVPFYSYDGRYARSRHRVSKFGNYILPWERQEEIFGEDLKSHVQSKNMWFWFYLTDGQEIINSKTSIPDTLKNDRVPANLIW